MDLKLIDVLNIPSRERTEEHVDFLETQTKYIKFFRELSEQMQSNQLHRACCQFMMLENFQAGENIFEAGSIGDKFYILLKGTVGVCIPLQTKVVVNDPDLEKTFRKLAQRAHPLTPPETAIAALEAQVAAAVEKDPEIAELEVTSFAHVNELGEGFAFGELALLNNQPRSATITASSDVTLAVLLKKDYTRLVAAHTEKLLNDKVDFLRKLPIFRNWSKLSISKLSFAFQRQTCQKGQVIYSENDRVDYVYFVKEGEFLLSKLFTQSPSVKPLQRLTTFSLNRTEKSLRCRLFFKGVMEMVGAEELFEKKTHRQFTCECTSNTGELWCITKRVRTRQNFTGRILHPDSLAFLQLSKQRYLDLYNSRVNEFHRTEEAKLMAPAKTEPKKFRIRFKKYETLHIYPVKTFSRTPAPNYCHSPKYDSLQCLKTGLEESQTIVKRTRAYLRRSDRARYFRKDFLKKLAPPSYLISLRKKLK